MPGRFIPLGVLTVVASTQGCPGDERSKTCTLRGVAPLASRECPQLRNRRALRGGSYFVRRDVASGLPGTLAGSAGYVTGLNGRATGLGGRTPSVWERLRSHCLSQDSHVDERLQVVV